MTPVSRIRGHIARVIRQRAGPAVVFTAWHVGCSLSMSACFYIEPTWQPVQNQPPEIVFPRPDETTLFLNIETTTTIRVQALDPEMEDLLFRWTPPPFAQTRQAPPFESDGLWVSQLEIDFDEDLDGQQLELTVADFPPDSRSVDFIWDIVVP